MKKVDGKLISILVDQMIKDFDFKNNQFLHLSTTDFFEDDFNVFKSSKFNVIRSLPTVGSVLMQLGRNKRKYDLLFADIPWGMRNQDERDICISTLDYLNSKGIGIYLMPSYLRTIMTHQGQRFLSDIFEKGFKVLGVIQLPENFMGPYSNVQTTLLFLTKDNGIDLTYFAKYENTVFLNMQINLFSFGMLQLYDLDLRKETDPRNPESSKITEEMTGLKPEDIEKKIQDEANLFDGIEADIRDFKGFEYWEQNKEIEKLDTEYGGYSFLELGELVDVNATRDDFVDIEDAIYIPAIGRTEVIDVMPTQYSKKKPQNFYQIIIIDHRLKKDYLLNYLNSELGQKTIEREFSKYSGATIVRLRIKDIKNLQIPVPNLGIQEEIIENVSKLKKVKELLNEIEKSLSIKPISSSEQLSKLNQVYESSVELSEPEIVFNDIKKGESTNREFKQTFALDVKTKKREGYIVFECVKTIAGFLNASGGTLYIGVADNSDITGIEVEIGKKQLFKSLDKYQLAIKDTLKNRIGVSSINNIKFTILSIRGYSILRLECILSDHQIFIDNKDTYLRVGPSTELLEGPELVSFSKERFK